MRSILTQVNPAKVQRTDLPIDQTNAAEIEKQAVAWNGIHTPIEIWIPDAEQREAAMECPELLNDADTILIMDGFHRTNVAVNLGYQSIQALLYDCTEDEFWDKRISQAKKHHAVEDARLHAWIVSSWRQTEFSHETGQSFANTIKAIENFLAGGKNAHPPKGVKELLAWFNHKAELWGRDAIDICKVILNKEGIYDQRDPIVRTVSIEQDLDADQTKKLTDSIRAKKPNRMGSGASRKDLSRYASEVVLQGKETPFNEWIENRPTVSKPPVETEAIRKRNRVADGAEKIRSLSSLDQRLDELSLVDFAEVLFEYPHLTEKLDRFFARVKKVSDKANMDLSIGLDDSELVALRSRILSLERQLREKTTPPVIVPESVLATSSSQLR